MIKGPFWLDSSPASFPPTHLASTDPEGLLAIGGELTPEWLMQAYSNGIFPWFNPDEPILWWSPNPRSVLPINALKIRRSLKKRIRQYARDHQLKVTFDTHFRQVMQSCAQMPREGQSGTWITDEMLRAYSKMHQMGYAHSVEVWLDDKLCGGLYGIQIGKMFFGESMFSKQADTSKIALVALSHQLQAWGFEIIDCQVETPHLNSLGAIQIHRTDFEDRIHRLSQQSFPAQKWQANQTWLDAVCA